MEDEESFSNVSAVLLALVSFVIYWVFLRPTATPAGARPVPPTTTTTTTTTSTPRTVRPRTPRGPAMMERPVLLGAVRMSEAAEEVLSTCQSKPNHVACPTTVTGLGGSNILLNDSGLVAFSYTQAASVVPTDATALRQDRIKILSRLCTSGNLPPSKGETMVLSVSQVDLGEPLSRILYALGTFYNLVVIVGVVESDSNSSSASTNNIVESLRTLGLSEEVLPSHRILRASKATGRVALVRQLSKVALVVDWESEVETQLSRFGFKVSLVSNWSKLIE